MNLTQNSIIPTTALVLRPQENTSENPFLDPVKSYAAFFYQYFSIGIRRVEKKFIPGKHISDWCAITQSNPNTLIVSARKHLKTTVALGFICWEMWRSLMYFKRPYFEIELMSYMEDLAAYQLKRLNRYIESIPELFGRCEKIGWGESNVRYGYQNREFICEPSGILSFKRGRHPAILICDDILKDPTNPKMPLNTLEMIERIFNEEIASMPTEQLHIFGTPQDETDVFSKIEKRSDYFCMRFPAIDEVKKTALWPEMFSVERLEEIKSNIGEKAFNKEFLCRPARGEDSYFKSKTLDLIIKPRLKNYDIKDDAIKLREYSFAGFDIGKKAHPSHLCILGESRRRFKFGSNPYENRLIQIHSKWMDGWDYTDQLEYLKMAIEKFKIAKLYFDNTRGEFESYSERGELPAEMEPFIFSLRSKSDIATKLDEKVTNKTLWLVNESRQRRQLLSVDNDFKAIASADGHGDCFFSLALAIRAWLDGKGLLAWSLESVKQQED